MPWHQQAMKGVVSCDKPRVVANRRQSEDARMGKPGPSHVGPSLGEYIAQTRRTGGTETSQYLEEKKATAIP